MMNDDYQENERGGAAQQVNDLEHLRLLAIGHYVLGGLGVCTAFAPLLYIVLGFELLSQHAATQSSMLMGMLVSVCVIMFIIGQAFAWALIYSGRQITRRRQRTFSVVVACICCICFPVGTILGVLALLVLSRNSVRALYETQARSEQQAVR